MEKPEKFDKIFEIIENIEDGEVKQLEIHIIINWEQSNIWLCYKTERHGMVKECDIIMKESSKDCFISKLTFEIIKFSLLNRDVTICLFDENIEDPLVHAKSCDSLLFQVCNFLNLKASDVFVLQFSYENCCDVDVVVFNNADKKLQNMILTTNYFNPHYTNELMVKLLNSGNKYADEIGFVCLMSDDNFARNEVCVNKIYSLIIKRLNNIYRESSKIIKIEKMNNEDDKEKEVLDLFVQEQLDKARKKSAEEDKNTQKQPAQEVTNNRLRLRPLRSCRIPVHEVVDLSEEENRSEVSSHYDEEVSSVIYCEFVCSEIDSDQHATDKKFIREDQVEFLESWQKSARESMINGECKNDIEEFEKKYLQELRKYESRQAQSQDLRRDLEVKENKEPVSPSKDSPDLEMFALEDKRELEAQVRAMKLIESKQTKSTAKEADAFNSKSPIFRQVERPRDFFKDQKKSRLLDPEDYEVFQNKKNRVSVVQKMKNPPSTSSDASFSKPLLPKFNIPKKTERSPERPIESVISQSPTKSRSIVGRKPIHYKPNFKELIENVTDRTGISPPILYSRDNTPSSISEIIDNHEIEIIDVDDDVQIVNDDMNNNNNLRKRRLYDPSPSKSYKIFKSKRTRP